MVFKDNDEDEDCRKNAERQKKKSKLPQQKDCLDEELPGWIAEDEACWVSKD